MSLLAKNALRRESNIELLRIILMLSIIMYHLLVHGAKVTSGPDGDYSVEDESSVVYILLKSFLVLSVNCFVFISGFYRIKFKVSTCINLLAQASFYSILITFTFGLLSLQYVGVKNSLEALFPVLSGTWWFITAYFALYLLSPLLNNAIDSFTKGQFLFVLLSLTVINCICGFLFQADPMGVNQGFSLVSFVHIYFLAQYIRKYANLNTLKKWAPAIYVVASTCVFLLALLSIGEMDEFGIRKIYAYNNPLVLIAAVGFFFLFQRFSFKSSFINSVSPYVLGIYLFHDHPFMRKHLIENLYSLSHQNTAVVHFLMLILFTVLIFLVGYLVDRLREALLTPVVRHLIRRFDLLRIEGIFSVKKPSSI
jgi:surface polysaccharide O-acyltransferase-like enzyme